MNNEKVNFSVLKLKSNEILEITFLFEARITDYFF